jgi:hypothetical protein
MEAYTNGVSTRKVERLVEQLGVELMSKSQASRICQALDERVEAFRNRPLEGAYPYLWLDARIERGPRHVQWDGAPESALGRLWRARQRAARGDRPGGG